MVRFAPGRKIELERIELIGIERFPVCDDFTDLALLQDVDLSRTRIRSAYLDGTRMTGVEVPDLEIYGELALRVNLVRADDRYNRTYIDGGIGFRFYL